MNPDDNRIYLSPPDLIGEEREFVIEALNSNWIAPEGPQLDIFEKELENFLSTKNVLALNSGTSSIHLGLKLLDVGPSDLVITPTFTFCAAVNPIIYLGAKPVFVDCEPENWGPDPELIERAIIEKIKTGSKPKAIILIHNYGMPAKINEITTLSEQYEIPILEDAAEAIGSRYGRYVGAFGAFGVLSFNGNKTLTTGGGGALICPNKEMYKKALKLATQAKEQMPFYHHKEVGYNYRMSNLTAAVGIGQMTRLQDRVKRKRQVYSWYHQKLDHPAISFLEEPEGCFSNRWLTTILLNSDATSISNLALMEILENHNIESRIVWQPLHLQPAYNQYENYTSGFSEELFSTGLCLPSGSSLTENQVDRIVKVILCHI